MKVNRNYKTSLVNGIQFNALTDEHEFQLGLTPISDMGYLLLNPNGNNEENVFFHRRVGNSVFVYTVNRESNFYHIVDTPVYLTNSVAYLNHLLDGEELFHLYKKNNNHIIMTGGGCIMNGQYYSVVDLDTSLDITGKKLTSNSTNYIFIKDGEYFVSTSNLSIGDGYLKIAQVITDNSGLITSYEKYQTLVFPEKGEAGAQGPQGVQGNIGPQGPIGPSGSFQFIEYQITNQDTVTITHNQNKYPDPFFRDSSGKHYEIGCTYNGPNQFTVTLGIPRTGFIIY